MRALIRTIAAAGAALALGPALAQDAPAAIDAMTCGEFLALGPQEQMDAMLALRASYNGEAPPPAGQAGEAAGAEDGSAGASGGSPRLAGMRTSCEGVPDVPALDAMLAAHADYD